MQHLVLFVVLFVSLCMGGGFGHNGWHGRAKPRGLDPERMPNVAVEARIIPANECRDNARIAHNTTTTDLLYVIEASQQCAMLATYGQRFMILRQNLTAYQLLLFVKYGYTVVRVADTEDGIRQYNATWRLNP